MSDDQDQIEFTLSFKPRNLIEKITRFIMGIKFGQGKVVSTSCALTRLYLQLFNTGKPIGKINYLFFKGNEWPSRILGSLAYTPGERILYFPGVSVRNVNWHFSAADGLKSIKSTGLVDHLTLEKNFQKWHATILEADRTKKTRLPSFKTKKIDENTLFWFGLSIKDPSVLEITPEELILNLYSPPSDTDRRLNVLIEARENAIFQLTHLSKKSEPLNEGEFLHFDFFIGHSNLDLDKLDCFVPTREPIVYEFKRAQKISVRGHPVTLEGITKKIWVVVSKHTGKLSGEAILSCL